MLKRITERFFSLFIHIFYKQIGTKIRTDAFKFFFDIFFVVFEKIGFKFDVISNNYVKLYDDIVEKEIKMAKISSNDHILVIGCGSLPATSGRPVSARTICGQPRIVFRNYRLPAG